jgi:hypothetical protein
MGLPQDADDETNYISHMCQKSVLQMSVITSVKMSGSSRYWTKIIRVTNIRHKIRQKSEIDS